MASKLINRHWAYSQTIIDYKQLVQALPFVYTFLGGKFDNNIYNQALTYYQILVIHLNLQRHSLAWFCLLC